ncbi:hypothetical protein MMPV_003431 [Pyropia vietnamensis]
MEAVHRTPAGQVVLSHLTSLAYSNLDTAEAGPGVDTLTARHQVLVVDVVCLDECWMWGTTRLICEVNERQAIATDADVGRVVADQFEESFLRVCGLMSFLATAVKRAGVALSAKVWLTALHFRGSLVYVGIPVTGNVVGRILVADAAARATATVVTGFHPPTRLAAAAAAARPPVSAADLPSVLVARLTAQLLSQSTSAVGSLEKDLIVRVASLRASDAAMKADGDSKSRKNSVRTFEQLCVESELSSYEAAALTTCLRARKGKAMEGLIFRLVDSSEAPSGASGHILESLVDKVSSMQALLFTAAPFSTADELLGQLANSVASSGVALFMLAADDVGTAAGVDRIARHAGMRTGLYPRRRLRSARRCPPPRRLLSRRQRPSSRARLGGWDDRGWSAIVRARGGGGGWECVDYNGGSWGRS